MQMWQQKYIVFSMTKYGIITNKHPYTNQLLKRIMFIKKIYIAWIRASVIQHKMWLNQIEIQTVDMAFKTKTAGFTIWSVLLDYERAH